MEARGATSSDVRGGAPAWLLGLVPLVLVIVAVVVFAALDGPGLGERRGPPAEELIVERTTLEPGVIELTVRNDGPDGSGGWAFTEQPVALDGVFAGSSDLAWGDYDGDGDPDLAVGSEGRTVIYNNDAGALTVTDIALPGYSEDSGYTGAYDLRSLTWADSVSLSPAAGSSSSSRRGLATIARAISSSRRCP